MPGAILTITDAGRAALVNDDNTGTVARTVTQIGIANAAFVASAALTVLPNEIKRIATISGENTAPDTIHVTIMDDSVDNYEMYGFGVYLDNGALFGVYSQSTPITEKAPAALLLLAIDVIFSTIDAALLTFGDASFTNPAATEERQGVIEIATQAETDTGTDDQRTVTPKKLKARLTALLNGAMNAGTNSQYWRGDKTWRDFATDVRATVLTGLSTATNAAIAATDTVLVALGKLQKQIADLTATVNGKEPTINAGTVSQYWRGDKTWRDFSTDVRAATLTGLSTITNAAIAATDTVLSSMGKLQRQISDHFADQGNPHGTTKAQVGLGNVDNTSDANKPVSVPMQAALDTKANISGASFTGNVGIGAASVSCRLNVVSGTSTADTVAQFGNATISGGLQIVTDGNLLWGLNALNGRSLVFRTNQVEGVRLDASQRLLVGSTTDNGSGARVQVAGAATVSDTLVVGAASTTAKAEFVGGETMWGNGSTQRAALGYNASQAYVRTVTAAGSDNYSLFLCGGGGQSDSRGAYIWLRGNQFATGGGGLQLNAGNVAGALVTVFAGGAERVRVTDTGSMFVGTTAPVVALGGEKLTVANAPSGTNTTDAIRVQIVQSATSTTSVVNLVSGVINGTNPYFALETRTNSGGSPVERLRVDANGRLLVNATADNGSGAIAQINGTVSIGDPGAGDNSSCAVSSAWVNTAIQKAVIPSGTSMLFVQTNAPVGWTKSVAHNDKALRIVSGAAGSGGTVSFSTAFANKSVNGSIGSTTLTLAQIPSHTHTVAYTDGDDGSFSGRADSGNANAASSFNTGSAGGDGSHTHSFSGTSIDMRVQYVDSIIAIKD